MRYKVINEELKIASCKIADLTMEQVTAFLKLWNDDSKIGSLTMFYDRSSEYLVLNEDNKDFSLYLDIVETYLETDYEGRKRIRNEVPASMKETVRVIEEFRQYVLINTWIERAEHNSVPNDFEMRLLGHIDGACPLLTAYNLGVIRGKRIERAKRKR